MFLISYARKLAISVAFLAFCNLVLAAPPTGFVEENIPRPDGGSWSGVVGITFADDGTMFVYDRSGKIWLIDESNPLPNPPASPVLDISDEVGGWRDFGLLGVALDPNFLNNGHIYLLYVVDRHHLLNCTEDLSGTGAPNCGPDYDAGTSEYFNATIGRITRYTMDVTSDFNTDYSSRKVLIGEAIDRGIPILHQSHGTGGLVFGTDGTLIASVGDAASYSSTDTGSASETYYAQALQDGIILAKENVGAYRSQLLSSYNGKLLRIDPSSGYGVASNPFYDASAPDSVRSRVWAMGLRNPFRIAHRPDTGDHDPAVGNPGAIYIGDVGWGRWEDLQVSVYGGENFGWPYFEGMDPHSNYSTRNTPNMDAPNPLFGVNGCTQEYFYFRELIKQDTLNPVDFTNSCDGSDIPSTIDTFVHNRPIIDWRHGQDNARWATYAADGTAEQPQIGDTSSTGLTVTGSPFRGNAAAGGVWYTGDDFPSEYKDTFFFADYGSTWIRNATINSADIPTDVRQFDESPGFVVALATHPINGRLYYVVWGTAVRRVSYAPGGNYRPEAVATSDSTHGPSPLNIQFSSDQSSDPDGNIASWDWDFGDGSNSSSPNPSHSFVASSSSPESFNVVLTVTDNSGATDSTSILVSTNNSPPSVDITSPSDGTLYSLTGDTVFNLDANISDLEHAQGQLSCSWQTTLHHNSHTHEEPINTSCSTTAVISPLGCGGETYFFSISLTVSDPSGLATSDVVTLLPDCGGPSNQLPTASFTSTPGAGLAPLAVSFDASASADSDGNIVSYAWNFGDGGSDAGVTSNHIFSTPGNYTVTLTVTDDDGATAVNTTVISVSDEWWDLNWSSQRQLTFDNSGINENLAGFPVLVRLTPADIDYSSIQANGEDLRFIDADGATVLPHEISVWNPSGESLIWVRVPQIDANSTTDFIWLYYGNPLAADSQDSQALWQSYAGVWHLDDDETDATANANHGTNVGTTLAAGRIGFARQFDGASYIDAGNDASLGITSAITIEAWVKPDPAVNGSPRILSKKIDWDDAEGYNLEFKPSRSDVNTLGSGNNAGRADNAPLGDSWHYVAATINGSTAHVYVDGVDVTTDTGVSTLAAGSTSLNFGRRAGGGDYLIGLLDELRISPSERSAAWIAAQFRSMDGGYVSVGSGGPGGNSSPPSVSLTQPVDGATYSASSNIVMNADAFDTDGVVTRVEFYSGTTLIGTDVTTPYSIVWPGGPSGSYFMKAIAIDDTDTSGTSNTVNITLVDPADTPVFADISAAPIDHGTGSRSISWGDYDDDGFDDVFVADTGDNQLFRNLGNGTFADVTAGPLSGPGRTHGGVWGDFDADGDVDLFVYNSEFPDQLLRNDGNGVFTDVTPPAMADPGNSHSANWGDFDLDGDIDLYVSSFSDSNKLWRNDGGVFTDITTSPLDVGSRSASSAAIDYDNDGDLDLFLVIDGGSNVLLRNDAGTFVNATPSAMQDNGAGFGSAWGDYDNDGDLDVYVTNIGGTPNQLWRNDGGGVFTDVASGPLADTDLGFATVWFDYDWDSDLDLFFTNRDTENRLLRNDGGDVFVDVTPPELLDSERGWGVGWSDHNRDGRLDLYVANHFTANKLYRNDTLSGNNWLMIDLASTSLNRFGVGARVSVRTGSKTQIREVSAGNGSGSQNSLVVAVGVGQVALIDEVEIQWPSGVVQSLTDVVPNQRITVDEPINGNNPPSVSLTQPATGATFIAPVDIAFSATAADSDGTIDRVEFYVGNSLIGSDNISPYGVTWTNALVGSHVVTAVAIDNELASRTSTASTIDVFAAPTITLTSPTDGATVDGPDVSFTYFINGAPGSYDHIHFTLDSNPQHITVRDLSGTYVYIDIPVGNHTMMVQLMDEQHSPVSAPDSVSFNVEITGPVNQSPQVSAGPNRSATTGISLAISGSVTDDGLPNPPATVTTQWTVQSGPATPTWPLNDGDSAQTNVVFPVAGVYVLRLTGDDSELSGFDETVVTVSDPSNQLPTASFTSTPGAGLAPLAVSFDASASADSDGNIVSYAWNFGDGGSDAGVTSNHIFSTPGNYTVTLTVTDDDGATAVNTTVISVSDEWWDLNWSSQRQLTFDNSGINENLAGFPVLVRLTPADIDYSSIQANGEDLRFIDADGATVLPHEISVWNPSGESLIWVRVPQIDANSTTDFIWLYYGNPLAADSQDSQALWQSYAGVWHLDDDETDATANANHGTNVGTTLAAGRIGFARQFDGASYIDAGNDASLGITSAITIEAWVKPDPAVNGSPRILSKKIDWDDAEGYNLEFKPSRSDINTLGSGNNAGRADNAPLGDSWHYVAATINGSTAHVYVDGVDVTTDTGVSTLAAGSTSLNFGRRAGGGDYLIGLLDELRISPSERSAAWIAAQFRSMDGGYVSVGSGGPGGNSSPSIILTEPSNGESFTAPIDLTLSADAVDLDGSIVRVDFYDGDTLIGSDLNEPFSIIWGSVPIGNHAVSATAIDDGGASDTSSTASIQVNSAPVNQSPQVSAGPNRSATTGISLAISGSVTDDGLPNPPATVTTQWTVQSGPATPTWPLNDGDSAQTNVVFPVAGVYVLRLTGDDSELSGFDETVVTVSDPSNQLPTASFTSTPGAGLAPLAVSFDASASADSDGNIVSYAWNFGDGGSDAGVTSNHIFSTPGNYTVTLTVTDDDGATAVNTTVISVSDEWWDLNWSSQRQLTFDNSGINENLAGFPVLVRLTPADIDYSSIQANGEDLRFIDADGATVLPHEISVWNPSGESLIWVRVPQIDANSTTDFIWLYYGNPLAADSQDSQALWQSYAGVWHLDDDETDATANANHGTNVGTTLAAGRIGFARQFDGASYIDAGNDASLGITSAITIEAWVKPDPAVNGSPRILSKKIDWDDAEGYNLEFKPSRSDINTLGSGNNAGRADNAPLGDSWHYVAATINGSTAHVYVDGVDVTTDTGVSTLAAGSTSLNFGRRAGGGDYLIGLLDELRISPSERSAAWIAAQFRSMDGGYVSVSQ